MITYIKFKNYKTFFKEVSVNFVANDQIKRFMCNSVNLNNLNVLKTVGIYGPNNTGKTCLVLALRNLRALMLNEPHEDLSNSFKDDNKTSFEVEYIMNGSMYRYTIIYDNLSKSYLSEELYKISVAPSNKFERSERKIVARKDNKLSITGSDDASMKEVDVQVSEQIPILKALNFTDKGLLQNAQRDYVEFALSIDIVRMDEADITDHVLMTYNLMKNDPKALAFVKEFVKNCDLHIDDFGFDEDIKSDVDISREIFNRNITKESLSFYSKHHGFQVPSFIFDSVGTRKIIALSGYIYDSIKNGKLLLIDEIDSSLHHIITRAIVSMFNNDLNRKAQLIFTTHDLLLMDLQHMFRKDQLYLTDIKNDESILISLNEFSSHDENGIRGNEDIINHYIQGKFGGVPTTHLFDSLEEAVEDGE